MAVTRLSDLIQPTVFNANMLNATTERSALFQSGVLQNDAVLAGNLAGGGLTFNVPFYNDLANEEPNIASDDPAQLPTPSKITTGQDVAIRNVRTKSWSSMDLNPILTGSDPMGAIRQRVADYWVRQLQRQLIAILNGVFADNAANDAGDMRVVIGTDAVGAPAAGELISDTAIIDAKQTMGDNAEGLAVLIMHSVVYSRLQKLDLIDYIQSNSANVRFATYLGYRVVVDDNVPAVAGANRIKYSTYLVGLGSIAWAESPPDVPVEVDRVPNAGNAMGQEILYTRRQYLMHPRGIRWMDAVRAGQFPTNAECATTANWNRVYAERKQIRLVELVTNG